MNIAVLSDIHDRTDHLELVIADLREKNCERIFCLGDLETPGTLNILVAMALDTHIDLVLGNNDFEITGYKQIASRHPRLTIHGIQASISCDGLRIGLTHMPDTATELAHTKRYDYIFYGHTHLKRHQTVGSCHLINPGEIMGRTGCISYGLLDTGLNQYQHRDIV